MGLVVERIKRPGKMAIKNQFGTVCKSRVEVTWGFVESKG